MEVAKKGIMDREGKLTLVASITGRDSKKDILYIMWVLFKLINENSEKNP